LSGINKDFLCVKGRFGFDFTKHAERIHQPMVRKGTNCFPVSWEEAAQAAATKLKAIYDARGKDAIVSSDRIALRMKRIICCSGWRARPLGIHRSPRTADYTGLTRRWANAPAIPCSLWAVDQSKAVLLVGNDPTNQNPCSDGRFAAVSAILARSYSSSMRTRSN